MNRPRAIDFPFVAELVRDATRKAVEARRGLPAEAIVRKPDGSVVTAVDVALQVYILDALARRFGEIATIAEEDAASIGGKPAAEAHCDLLLRQWGFEGGAARRDWALACGGLDGPTRDSASNFVGGPKRLPVRYALRPADDLASAAARA